MDGEILGEITSEVIGHRATDIEVGVAFFADEQFDKGSVFAQPAAHLVGGQVFGGGGGHLPDAQDALDFGEFKVWIEIKDALAFACEGLWSGGDGRGSGESKIMAGFVECGFNGSFDGGSALAGR